jgi:signal transduction histidine kinase
MASSFAWRAEHTALALLWLLVGGAFLAYGRTLRRAERQKRFASHVTHELRSPLTTFSLYSDLLAEGMVKDADKQEEYLQTLRSESERMGHMIENVIAQARLEEGRARMLIEATTLRRVVDEVRPALEHCCSRNGMTLSIELGDAADASLQVDRPAVGRILTNLVENACKYGREGDSGLLAITAETRAGSIRLRVRDHGPGVPPEMARRIFRVYDRAGRDETDPMRGLGLGLPLSRELARKMGGDLTYEAPSDGGATFVVTLPCVRA